MEYSYELLDNARQIYVAVNEVHRFGIDAILLSDFAKLKSNDRCLDLCCGNGVIPMTLWRNWAPKQLFGVEVQEEAYQLSLLSAQKTGISDRFTPILADLKDLDTIRQTVELGSLDAVTCNPPYKAAGRGIRSESDATYIVRHEALCSIEDVCKTAAKLLRFGGGFYLCQRPERLADVMEAMRKNGIEPKRLRFVSKNESTPPWLFLLEGRRGGKPFLQVMPPLFAYKPDGTFTDAVMEAYRLPESQAPDAHPFGK
jgi:tRNA1(Val) A37 N6-methylase TrmN6